MPAPDPIVPATPDLKKLLIQVMDRVTEFLEVERSTIFLHDEKTNELWTPVAQGSEEIRIPRSRGIAAHVFETGEKIYLADAYADPRFNSTVDKRSGFLTRDLYCRPISDSAGKRIGVIQLLNRRAGPYSTRDEALLDAICGQAGVAIENTQLFLRLAKVYDSERGLHTELESKHAELQKAFLKIEDSAAAQELLNRRIHKARLVAMLTAVALFVAVGLFAWLGGSKDTPAGRPKSSLGPLQWQPVTTRPVRTGVVLLGNIEPLEIRNLTAPLTGRIAEKNFQYGELVTKGQVLARLDTTDVEVELRNAEAAAFKATAELTRLTGWSKSPEVAKAGRNLLKARLSFEANQRNLKEMEQLSSLGIIAQSSLDSARQQFTTEEADFASAKEELDNVMTTATEDRLTMAKYDVENTKLHVADLREQMAHATLVAPFAGIVILPNVRPTAGRPEGHDGFYEQGSTVNAGNILLAIGNLEGVAVKTRVDEVDIARIRHNQPVAITGDAFAAHPLSGLVSYVSSQAITTGARPYFEIRVKTGTLAAEALAAIRLGMTARIDITVYDTPSALVVPVTAVRRNAEGTFVYRRGANGQPEPVAVTLGATLPDAVEIRSGLKPGDNVVVNARALSP